MNLNVTVPLNSVSLGFCGYNILREFYNRGISPNLFPIGQPDLSSFDKCTEDFKFYLQSCANKALKNYSRDYPEFRLWHTQGSETSHSKNQNLLTFLETNKCTDFEVNILNNQAPTFVTSSFTKGVMEAHGIRNVVHCPLGFDSENYGVLNKPHAYNGACTVFGLFGKAEGLRKKTFKTLKLWAAKYGNNPKYRLHLHVYNIFLHQDPNQCAELNKQLIAQALEGKQYWNINLINSYLKTSTELNSLYNSVDIVLELGGSENWSLPSFNSTAIGKHLVALNTNGVADWANEENAVLVKPSEQMLEAHDGQFFHRGAGFNQGEFYDYNSDEAVAAMETAVKRYETSKTNTAGLQLQKDFTWEKTVDTILNTINKTQTAV